MANIQKKISVIDLGDAMNLDILNATEEELISASREIERFAPAMMKKLNAIKDRHTQLLSNNYQQGTMLQYLFNDGASQEALVEERVEQYVNTKRVKQDAGIEVVVTSVDNQKLADCISVRKVLNNKKLLRLYNNGDSSLSPYVTEHRYVQTKLFDIVESEDKVNE